LGLYIRPKRLTQPSTTLIACQLPRGKGQLRGSLYVSVFFLRPAIVRLGNSSSKLHYSRVSGVKLRLILVVFFNSSF